MRIRKDLTGLRYGKLVVVEYLETKNRNTYWKCKCDCGNYKNVYGFRLYNGTCTSCGCERKVREFGPLAVKEQIGLVETIKKELKELREKMRSVSVRTENGRFLIAIYGAQIAVLERLSPELINEAKRIYEMESRNFDRRNGE